MGGTGGGGTFVEWERMKTSYVNGRENAKAREKKREAHAVCVLWWWWWCR